MGSLDGPQLEARELRLRVLATAREVAAGRNSDLLAVFWSESLESELARLEVFRRLRRLLPQQPTAKLR